MLAVHLAATAACTSGVRPPARASTSTTLQPSTYTRTGHSLFSGRGFFIGAAFIGNDGWDPANIATAQNLVPLRHAELKHARLAMLAAVGWPVQELVHPLLCQVAVRLNMEAHSMLVADGLSPTVLNGGLQQPEVAPALALGMVLGAIAELRDCRERISQGLAFNEWALDSVAGDANFDPLGIATQLPVTERFELQQAEMINGRLAMLAVAGFCLVEAHGNVPVTHLALFDHGIGRL